MSNLQSVIHSICTQRELAARIGVQPQSITHWINSGVPAKRVLSIYQATRGAVTPHELRPDIYPDSDWLPPLDPPNDREAA